MDDNTMKIINEALNTDMLAKVNGAGGVAVQSDDHRGASLEDFICETLV